MWGSVKVYGDFASFFVCLFSGVFNIKFYKSLQLWLIIVFNCSCFSAQGPPLGILLFSHDLSRSKALSWEVITYCLTAPLRDFVRSLECVLIQRPFMGILLRCSNYVMFVVVYTIHVLICCF